MQPTPYLCLTLTPGSQPRAAPSGPQLTAVPRFFSGFAVTASPPADPADSAASSSLWCLGLTFLAPLPHPIRATRDPALLILSRPSLNRFAQARHIISPSIGLYFSCNSISFNFFFSLSLFYLFFLKKTDGEFKTGKKKSSFMQYIPLSLISRVLQQHLKNKK